MDKLSPRDRIVATATRLFNQGGAHTIGIDQIISESGVAKRTFYNHFPSKTKLLVEYFHHKDDIWFSLLTRYTSDLEADSLERLLGIFDGLKEWFSEKDFFGCPFIRGLSDFGADSKAPELTECIADHFNRTSKLLETLLKEVRPKDYKKFVPRILSLVAGATIVAHATGDPKIADVNKAMARTLLSSERG